MSIDNPPAKTPANPPAIPRSMPILHPLSCRAGPPSLSCIIKAVFGPLLYIVAVVAIAQLLGLRPASADPIDQAEAWFNNITTYQANFVQVSSDGSNARGTFYMKRPHLSRFEYVDDIPLTLITTETWLHVDEADRREVTSYPVIETPLALLLGDPVRLRDTGVVTSSDTRDGILSITIEKLSGEAAGKLVLEFSKDPLELRRWLITDANGITTSLLLTEPQKGTALSAKLFIPTVYPSQNTDQ